MAISAAKLEANRRNAGKSTGPRTQAGKDRSRLNALDHGCRAAIPVLPAENGQALDDRKDAWRASLAPGDAVEQSHVDDAVAYTWQQDRARRAQAARLETGLNNAGVEQARREAEHVLFLGQKLFDDRRGLIAVYPHSDVARSQTSVPRLSYSHIVEDPEDPPRLVLHLQATAGGCQWMFDRWSALKSILEDRMLWQSPDKLKAVRLLGCQPVDAADDRRVLMVFLACQTMEGHADPIIPEIWNELTTPEQATYAQRLAGRGIDRLRPKDAAAARQILLDIVDRAMAQIRATADEHRRRADADAALAVDRLAFDDSPGGERLRRYELACGRGIARSLDALFKLRRSPHRISTVESGLIAVIDEPADPEFVSDPLSVVSCTVSTAATAGAPNEPTADCENAPNEPTATGGDSSIEVDCRPLAEISCGDQATEALPAQNEPTAARPDEPNDGRLAAQFADGDHVGKPATADLEMGEDSTAMITLENATEWLWAPEEPSPEPICAMNLDLFSEEIGRDAAPAEALHKRLLAVLQDGDCEALPVRLVAPVRHRARRAPSG
jgi:hypothetical protein